MKTKQIMEKNDQQNGAKQAPAKIVAMKIIKALAERPNVKTSDGSRGRLVVIDSQPPVADNTTLMLYTVKLAAVDEGRPSAYFSLGTQNTEIVNILVSIITGIGLQKIQSGRLSDEEWALLGEKLPSLNDAPLYIDDTEGMTLDWLDGRLTDLATENNVTFAVIDHVRRLGGDAETVPAIKAVAERLGITVIAVMD
jgi:replicative DNA helicase